MDHPHIGNRVLILGCPGSGKSTFARALAARTGLPLIHLDSVWWRADGSHISRDEFDRALSELLAGEKWIMDGDYSRTYEVRLRAADTVIFLDYPEDVCMAGIVGRLGEERPDMPWTESALDPELVAMVKNYARDNRPVLLDLLRRYADRQVLVFTDRTRADRWLSEF
ncbi:MAG: adenylate kinase [Clostridia bacterium]|nr:adenylate kinase [Clostridia bacterium]